MAHVKDLATHAAEDYDVCADCRCCVACGRSQALLSAPPTAFRRIPDALHNEVKPCIAAQKQ